MTDVGWWQEWVYDPVTGGYAQRVFRGIRPPDEEYEAVLDPSGNPLKIGGEPVYIRKGTGPMEGTSSTLREPLPGKTAAEIVASQYATVSGRDVYIESDYERDLRKQGVARDQAGYYEWRKGEKVYLTGYDDAGVRGRWMPGPFVNSPRELVPFDDDLLRRDWVTPSGTDAQLRQRLVERNNLLDTLRRKYENSRGDSWMVRQNLLVRIRDLEDEITALNRSLGADPQNPPGFILHGPQDKDFNKQGIMLSMAFGLYSEEQAVQFTEGLSIIPGSAHVMVRLAISFDLDKFTPGQLSEPDVVRVRWIAPMGFLPLDNVPISGTDEFVNSQPLVVVRDFRAPAGVTWVGGPEESLNLTDVTFGAVVVPYRLVVDPLDTPEDWHWEGNDGYWGAAIGNPDAPGASTLASFMNGLCMEESNCQAHRVNKQTGAFGKWQIMPRNWPIWSKDILGTDPGSLVRDPITGKMMWPKTEANIEFVAFTTCANIYKNMGSWRRVAVAWHHGRSWAKKHPDAGKPGTGGGLEKYVRRILERAGIPMD
jgi:hypothetical protein